MRTKLLALALALTLPACVIHSADEPYEPGVPGDITFQWNFEGKTCAQATDVASVQVRLWGPSGIEEWLANDGLFACSSYGTDGITLLNFSPGTYSFQIDAYAVDSTRLYTTSGSVRVNGDVWVSPRLNRALPTMGSVRFAWTFPNDFNCTTAGLDGVGPVSKVIAKLDGEPTEIDCGLGGGRFIDLVPGNHVLSFEGVIVSGTSPQVWYYAVRSFIVTAGQDYQLGTVVLEPVATQVTFKPVMKSSPETVKSCGETFVKVFAVQIYAGTLPIGQDVSRPCADTLFYGYLPTAQRRQSGTNMWEAAYRVVITALDEYDNPRYEAEVTSQVFVSAVQNTYVDVELYPVDL